MEIGSFIELQFPKTGELYSQSENIARLNTGRAAVWHAFRCSGCKTIWVPYYQCDTVRDFLKCKNVGIRYYHIDSCFNPIDLQPSDDEAVLIVNYFGIMSHKCIQGLAEKYSNVIIDNSQAFFSTPIDHCFNVYSCRKFVGVPDGAYVIGKHAELYSDEYQQGFSSDTALFMLQRIEYGCEGKAYESRRKNEQRIDNEDVMLMSKLTRTILNGTDYRYIREKRRQNFDLVHRQLGGINKLNPLLYYDESCVPMVYPLLIEDDDLLHRLQRKKHFQGHWWSYLLDEMQADDFEYWISRYVIPITIDQRYGSTELKELCSVVLKG